MATIRSDKIVAYNGRPVENGEYIKTTTVAARAVRHLLAWKGHWRGKDPKNAAGFEGCEVWPKHERSKDSEENQIDIMRGFELALKPLVMEGAINSVETWTELRAGVGRVFGVRWKSNIGERTDIVFAAPWSLNS